MVSVLILIVGVKKNLMKNVTTKICILIFIVLLNSNILLSNEIEDNIIKMRISYYENKYIPSSDKLLSMYENDIKNTDDFESRAKLTALWGIVYTELTLYYYTNIKESDIETLTSLYKKHRQEVKRSKVSETARLSGEFAFLMLKLHPSKYVVYMQDTRILFLKALVLDKNNIKAKFGIGKWWAYVVIDRNHREVNNASSQVNKYLGDAVLEEFSGIDAWDSVDLFNIYYTRSIFNMRTLNTEVGYKDLTKAKKIHPNSNIVKKLDDLYGRNIVKWF